MTDDITHAFDHPEARARATSDAMPDRISLRDHIVTVEIGAFQVERDATQRLSFNIVVEVTPPDAPLEDDVDRILSYDRVTEAIATELAAERLNLLETLADRIAARILREPQAMRVFVRIEKLDRGPGALGVEIVRARKNTLGQTEQNRPAPLVVFLSNSAISSDDILTRWLEQLSGKVPVILCVGPPETPVLHSTDPSAQRHIDLLAIEQNAWAVAGSYTSLSVAGTRTELDWAMKNGRTSVWAPTKLILDAVDGPTGPVDAKVLAAWFAAEMQAVEFRIIDMDTAS